MRPVEREVLKKTIHCGTEYNGYQSYFCTACEVAHHILFSCKTRLCGWCGAKANEKFADAFVRRMLPVSHRHITFTMPRELWPIFHRNAALQQELSRAAFRAVKNAVVLALGLMITLGCMNVLHNFGRDLKDNCHVHMIVTEGGSDKDGNWVRFTYFPFVKGGRIKYTLNEVWRDEVLELLRRNLPKTPGNDRFIEGFRKRYPGGFYVNSPSEARIKTSKSLKKKARYITRYVKHPVISDSRLVRYDGRMVEFWYDHPSTGVRRTVVMSVMEFISAVLRHIPEKHFRAVTYYGLYSPNFPQIVRYQSVFDSEGEPLDPFLLSWKERMYLQTGHHPDICRMCGREMVLVAAVYWKNGDLKACYHLGFQDRAAIHYPDNEMWLSRGVSRLAR
jgi:hypothetical protein